MEIDQAKINKSIIELTVLRCKIDSTENTQEKEILKRGIDEALIKLSKLQDYKSTMQFLILKTQYEYNNS